MADTSNVNSQKITAAVGRMQTEASNIAAGVQKFSDAVTALDRQWTSEAKAAFMQAYQTDREAMDEMIEQLNENCDLLRNMADTFDAAESDILSKVSSLR